METSSIKAQYQNQLLALIGSWATKVPKEPAVLLPKNSINKNPYRTLLIYDNLGLPLKV